MNYGLAFNPTHNWCAGWHVTGTSENQVQTYDIDEMYRRAWQADKSVLIFTTNEKEVLTEAWLKANGFEQLSFINRGNGGHTTSVWLKQTPEEVWDKLNKMD